VQIHTNKNTGSTELELAIETIPLSLPNIPRIISIGKISESLVTDLTWDEEQCIQGMCHVSKIEGVLKGVELVGEFTFADLRQCLSVV
jgi:exosome complex RNA-binding protein Rrp42 (RNase PH superfamily)